MASVPAAVAVVADNHHDHALESNCPTCQRGLFSEGLRVVFVAECRHYFHEECLHLNLRVRHQDSSSRACPVCRRHLAETELIQPVDFHDLSARHHVPQTIVMAKKLVQKLLWTSITANVLPLLKILFDDFILARPFANRLDYVQGSGIS